MPERDLAAQPLAGRVAIVTGAGAGIGREAAMLLASRGARVLVNDRGIDADARASGAAAVATAIKERGGIAIVDATPVGTPGAARTIVSAALEAFGRIDVLVNNAGIVLPGDFAAHEDADVERVLSVNLSGAYALLRAAWPALVRSGRGRVVNLSSSAALGSGLSGPYAIAKAGLLGLTKEAAIAGAPLGIRVNALLPTAYTALLARHPDPDFRERMRSNFPPRHVATAIAWLASDEVPCNGEIFTAGGGHFARIGLVESAGIVDPEATPETLQRSFEQLADLSHSTPLRSQADHQALQNRRVHAPPAVGPERDHSPIAPRT